MSLVYRSRCHGCSKCAHPRQQKTKITVPKMRATRIGDRLRRFMSLRILGGTLRKVLAA